MFSSLGLHKHISTLIHRILHNTSLGVIVDICLCSSLGVIVDICLCSSLGVIVDICLCSSLRALLDGETQTSATLRLELEELKKLSESRQDQDSQTIKTISR